MSLPLQPDDIESHDPDQISHHIERDIRDIKLPSRHGYFTQLIAYRHYHTEYHGHQIRMSPDPHQAAADSCSSHRQILEAVCKLAHQGKRYRPVRLSIIHPVINPSHHPDKTHGKRRRSFPRLQCKGGYQEDDQDRRYYRNDFFSQLLVQFLNLIYSQSGCSCNVFVGEFLHI